MSSSIPADDAAARLAAIVASSDDIIVGKTRDGIVTSWNPAAERILGYTAREAIGQHITLIIPHDRWAEETEVLARIRRGERVDHFQTVRRTKSGTLLNISLTVSPIRDAQGNVVGASKVGRDISDQLRGQEERDHLLRSEKKARESAQEANRLKDEFLAVVSHELRSPLQAIMGWASLLRTGNLDSSQTERAIETILRNAEAQNQLIGDLLDVSRIISGKLRLNIRQFDLGSIIEAAVEVVRPAAEAKTIRVQFLIDPSAGSVAGDPDRLQQVLWNLLSNAVKFTPRGGRVQIRSQRIDSHVEIVVTDTGKGIEPNLLPAIFDRFRQGQGGTAREYGGLGLGLAIVRHLVELHGGTVSARSEGTNKGSEFSIQLPLSTIAASAKSKAQAGAHPSADGVADSLFPSLAGLRILIVDDEPDAREVVALILVKAGAEVISAGDVRQAIGIMDQWRPNVLISDLGMPGEDGYDLIRQVRARPAEKLGNIPAIALTALGRTQDRLKVLSAGYQMHVPKPVEPIELVTVIASVTKKF